MKTTSKSLEDVPAYRSFIKARDRAIERILNRSIVQANDLLRNTLSQVVSLALSQFENLKKAPNQATEIARLNASFSDYFEALAQQIAVVQSKALQLAQYLAAVGEAEALGRVLNAPKKYPSRPKLPTRNASGEPILGRTRVGLAKIQRDIIDAIQASIWLEEDAEEMRRRLARALPKRRVVKRPKRILKPFREAAEDNILSFLQQNDAAPQIKNKRMIFAQGVLDMDVWREIVDAVTEEYIASYRGPEHVLGAAKIGTDEETRYAWQLEQEQAHDLVDRVRAGQDATARENGITEFVWIAIIDDKTDDCCRARDGLLTKEIEDKLSSGEIDGECDAIAPPAHFNCRCRLAPVLDAKDLEVPESKLPEFEEWLTEIRNS